MKPEIKQLILKELSDLKGRKFYSAPDARVELFDKKMIPYEEVKPWFEKYQELGSLQKTAKHFETQTSQVLNLFRKYKFPYKTIPDLKNARNPQIQQEEYDAQTMDFKTWKAKHNKSETLYYRRRGTKKPQMETLHQESIKDTQVLNCKDWCNKYNLTQSSYYRNYRKFLDSQNVDNL